MHSRCGLVILRKKPLKCSCRPLVYCEISGFLPGLAWVHDAVQRISGFLGGRSSVGRAPDCGSGGRGFNPHRSPQFLPFRALVFMPKGKQQSLPVIGTHALRALLYENPELLLEIWVSDRSLKAHAELLQQAEARGLAISRVKPDTLTRVDKAHRGLLGWCRPPRLHNLDWLLKAVDSGLLLALDRVTDAHNFGACLRSAEAAGVAAVLLPARHAAGLSAGAAKSSSGALFRVPLVACNSLPYAIDRLSQLGWEGLALCEQAEDSLYSYRPGDKTLLVAGNEQQGISTRVLHACNRSLGIPCRGRNSSLNVAVATGAAVLWCAAQMRE